MVNYKDSKLAVPTFSPDKYHDLLRDMTAREYVQESFRTDIKNGNEEKANISVQYLEPSDVNNLIPEVQDAADKEMYLVLQAIQELNYHSDEPSGEINDIIESVFGKMKDEVKQEFILGRSMHSLESAVKSLDSESVEPIIKDREEALKTALASDNGARYQAKLDKMLVTSINARTAQLKELGEDSAPEHEHIAGIVTALLGAGASAKADDYAALKATQGNKWFVGKVFDNLTESLKDDENPEKVTALNDILSRCLSYGGGTVKKLVSVGAEIDSLDPDEAFKLVTDENLPIIAAGFKGDKKEQFKSLLTGDLARVVFGQAKEERGVALIKAGADIAVNDFQVVKSLASGGHKNAVDAALDTIEDKNVRDRVTREVAASAVNGSQLYVLQKLAERDVDLDYGALHKLAQEKLLEVEATVKQAIPDWDAEKTYLLPRHDDEHRSNLAPLFNDTSSVVSYLENKKAGQKVSANGNGAMPVVNVSVDVDVSGVPDVSEVSTDELDNQ